MSTLPLPLQPAQRIVELMARNAQLEVELRRSQSLFQHLAERVEHVHQDELEATQSILRQNEEIFRRVFDHSPLGMSIASSTGQFLMVNQRCCEITGYSQAELLTLTVWDVTHPEDRYKEFERLQDILRGRTDIISLEKRYVRKDGTVIWVKVTASFIKDDAGELQYQIGMLEDVSDRKRAEAELKASLQDKDILLKEIHHRVKNNMQTVSSLLSLQASYIEDPEILTPFTASQNRVKAMALIHERLYRSDSLGKIHFSDYAHQLVTDLVKSYQCSNTAVVVNFEIAEIELEAEVALSCGLIVNEAVYNALKHAFPRNRAGQIWVRFTSGEGYQLAVADDGIGLPPGMTLHNSDSLGLQLIAAFAKKLHGQVSLDRGDGTTVTVRFAR